MDAMTTMADDPFAVFDPLRAAAEGGRTDGRVWRISLLANAVEEYIS